MAAVESTIPTPFGEAEIVVNTPTLLLVRADSAAPIKVNRVPYTFRAVLERPSMVAPWTVRAPTLSLSKVDSVKYGDYSWSARDKLGDGLEEAVNDWEKTDAGRIALAKAEIADYEERLTAAHARVDAATAELTEAHEEVSRLLSLDSLPLEAGRLLDSLEVPVDPGVDSV